ncbi:MAG TPA: MMPL family transporter [Thermoanaerobaculia bacterium]|jgi:predicted RND superfamily exporter protein|nr:MMPL family transporter [Thermoanaerobaculia bacterium]
MRISTFLASAVCRRPRLLLAATVLLTFAALVPALRFRLETDLAALLPEGAPGAEDYRLFLRTFGGFEKVFVIVRSPGGQRQDPALLTGAAERLADILGRSPEVAEARSGLTEEDERFFLTYVAPRLPLLIDSPGWRGDLVRRLEPQAIHARVSQMRQMLRGPAGPVAAPFLAADPLGLSEGLLDAAATSLPIDPLTGSFLSRRGDAALVILTPARAEIDPAGGRALLAELDRAYTEVRRSAGTPLDFKAVGGPIYAAQDEALLRGDLSRTATASGLGVIVLLLLGFGGAFIPLVILASVVAGLVWTVAATAVWLGSITVVGVGFAAALLGMGVEYGIHGGSRFRQLRLAGNDAVAALAGTFRDPGPGIVSSALTTAAGLGALCLAHFRPLRELGQVLTVGVLVTLLTTVAFGAAVLVGFPRRSAVATPPRLWQRFGQPSLEAAVGFASRRPAMILALATLLTALSAWGLSRLSFSTDLRSLRPADHPSAEAERLLVETFAVGLDTFTVVAPGRTLDEALDKAAAVRPVLESRLGSQAEITSPAEWLIQGRRLERRLRELRRLPLARAADDFERELRAAGFNQEPFAPALAALRGLARGEDPNPPPRESWPRWMSELVRVGPAGAAAAVHVRVPLGAQGTMDGLARDLRRISPDLALASVPRVGGELRHLALQDLARSSALALALVAAVVLVSVRWRIGDALLSSLPLALGCLWTFGLWGSCGGHVDLLAISTLPVLFGTGIDLGVHAVHGGRLRPEEGIRGTIENSGLAMILIALTTGVGFGSLGSSRVPGIQNAGTLVALGVVACLVATFLVLPALESLIHRRQEDGSPELKA